MKKLNPILAGSLIVIFFISMGCQRVPISGRQQLNILPESQMLSMALTSYDDFLKENPVSNDMIKTRMVKTVGANIANAVYTFLKSQNQESRIEGYEWEFNYVQQDTPNAWCMPGGKVVVYSGLMPYTPNETSLAVVLAHEIAHAVARHGNERMSQGLLMQFGGLALDIAIEKKPDETKLLFQTAYGITTQIGIALPYSRLHETEADKLGLIFMAIAGYNPEAAIDFWSKMAQASGSNAPEFLSTHPSDETRIKNLKNYLPEALKYYKK